MRRATLPAAWPLPRPDAENSYGGEVSWRALGRHQSYPNPRASERSLDFRKRVDEFANMSDEELRQYVYGNKESDR
jgi:hypothetical protein